MLRNRFTDAHANTAFTLIELLVVVAILATLAAIAIPNMLEAHTRSKVSRVKSDLRTAAAALEAYAVDQEHYPPDAYFWCSLNACFHLTTPVAYMTSVPTNPFNLGPSYNWYHYTSYELLSDHSLTWGGRVYSEHPDLATKGIHLKSIGPDLDNDNSEWIIEGMAAVSDYGRVHSTRIYDPTNGTISDGDIMRLSGAIGNGVPLQP